MRVKEINIAQIKINEVEELSWVTIGRYDS